MSVCVTCCIIRALGTHGAAMETRIQGILSAIKESSYTKKARNSLMNRENVSVLGKSMELLSVCVGGNLGGNHSLYDKI